MKFYELAIGARFLFRGQQFKKTAMSMAEVLAHGHQADGLRQGWGCVFMGEVEVVSQGPLLPPEVAAKWKPERGHWAAVVDELCSQPGTTSCPSDGHSQSGAFPARG